MIEKVILANTWLTGVISFDTDVSKSLIVHSNFSKQVHSQSLAPWIYLRYGIRFFAEKCLLFWAQLLSNCQIEQVRNFKDNHTNEISTPF